jgi:glycosyltransferase involved in cell wall biosynthesis
VQEASGVDSGKIAVITNGVDLAQFQPVERHNAIRSELGLSGQFVASYVGTLGMAHGLETVLDAAEQLRDHDEIRSQNMGEGVERDHLAVERRRHSLPNVLLLEGQPHERIPEVLAASAACMVLLRNTDLFKTVLPAKLFEAMGAARPIILGVSGEAGRIVRGGSCGIVIEPENAEELAGAAAALESQPARSEQLGRNGRALAERDYDRDHLARSYADLLPTALDRSRLRPRPARSLQEVGVRGGEAMAAGSDDPRPER